jgi:D-alanyl-D-alanine carboxypeptidase/D-alanyl-D-alanine-endopeptidase (penicillin-binding protein 4)
MPRVSRSTLTLLVACTAAALAPAVASARVDAAPQALAKALTVPHVAKARTGAIAIDLETGESVFALHQGLSLRPASNEKLAVTFAALAKLGADFQMDTDVIGHGELDGTTWNGDLVLQGHGDPTLSSAGLVSLARQVYGQGIRRVSGRIVADESFFDARRTGPGWKPSYYINESPPLSALTVDRARYGRYTAGDPAITAATLFRNALRARGVAVPGAIARGRGSDDDVILAWVDSPPLLAILRYMDHESDNFTAELLLKQLGASTGLQGTSARGAAVVRQALADADVPLAGVVIADGSGLSLLDRATARELGGILEAAWDDPDLQAPFMSALAVAGVNGTLHDRMRRAPARGNVLAKTGTTSLASALSGFAGKRYAFSVVQNGSPISAYWARTAQDRFATALAAG